MTVACDLKPGKEYTVWYMTKTEAGVLRRDFRDSRRRGKHPMNPVGLQAAKNMATKMNRFSRESGYAYAVMPLNITFGEAQNIKAALVRAMREGR